MHLYIDLQSNHPHNKKITSTKLQIDLLCVCYVRFKVIVVTAAAPEWAFSAWALILDPKCKIIPVESRKDRIYLAARDPKVAVSKILTR